MISWITPAGLLGTATELTTSTFNIVASGTNITYKLIGGNLPTGMSLSASGTITGAPAAVLNLAQNKFVIRATDGIKSDDRTFRIDIANTSNPQWLTPAGFLPLGKLDQKYDAYNHEYISYQLLAVALNDPVGTELTYLLVSGTLPPGLTLSRSGLIEGAIRVIFHNNTGISKAREEYSFTVRASNGAVQSTRAFNILVVNPHAFKADSTYLNINTSTSWNDYSYFNSGNLPTSVSFLQPVQFYKGSDLGTVRASTNEIISIGLYHPNPANGHIHDPNPKEGPITFAVITGTTVSTRLPEGLELDPDSGNIYGFIPYQPAYTRNYNITISATKTDVKTHQQVTATNTFTLAVQGDVDSVIEWITEPTLYPLVTGETSELYVKAREINSTYNIRYTLVDGELPTGITLNQDGALAGSAEYNAVGSYQFTILATDVYGLSAKSRTFTLNVAAYDNKQYSKIYVKPFLKQSSRDAYQEFINDDSIFPLNYIYRNFDPNFGIQQNIKMYLEFGIENIPGKILITGSKSYWFAKGRNHTVVAIDKVEYPGVEYTPVGATITIQGTAYTITQVDPDPGHSNLHLITFLGTPSIECSNTFTIESYQGFMNKIMVENFYRRNLYFGDIKLAIAQDTHGNNLYEVIYADIVDSLVNKQGVSITKQFEQNNQTVYPASIPNMKTSLESVILPNNAKIKVNEYNLPRFMRTAQPGSYIPLGYVKLVPICYALPGQGFKIIDRIKHSGFDFKQLNFEVDRLVLGNGPNNDSAKYLIFDRQSLSS